MLLVLSPVLVWSSCGQAENNAVVNNDAVANERPPLTGDDLAKYWKLDCQHIAVKTNHWAELELSQQIPDMASVDWRGLELCAVIYNVRNTGRYQPCPDYGKTLLLLKSIRSGESEINTARLTIADYLMQCGKDQ